ncbi:Hydrogenase transcriptional regulatory protein hupR1 [Rubripirellula lacrimiformis]|uniref:Hydrogenase transcriptional regulatory protein hupR1 n=1 Tax=Rubripirellula lacrimiformis TaxID=1930273 RepID=A0A517NIG5_9BACT|nr:response regulator [Rubripirellula lacrimiformis]QDT06924.1 Hydrogenase transcriptional regulatory protein hupR1 [Rubripirellula lacrimiformis]
MQNKLLFVDDDPILLGVLSGIASRGLGPDFEINSCEGGETAIEAANSLGPFSVVVVDMQMPKMNGIETIGHLREKMPKAVFVMLTGNKDQETAIQAINAGQLFRFLSKPCKAEELTSTILAAQTQYNKLTSRNELLSKTLAGTLDLMTDLIEMPSGRNIDTTRMLEAIKDLARRMSVELDWEEEIAARVFLVGIATLSPREAEIFDSQEPTTVEHRELFAKICRTSAGLLRKMPRFDWIVELLHAVPSAERFHRSGERIDVSAVLLRVVFYWNFLTMKGLCVEAVSATIRKILPEVNDLLIDAMECLHDNRDALCLTRVSAADLRPGMIPHEDITGQNGSICIAGGRRLTQSTIENMSERPGLMKKEYLIVSNSILGPQYAG